jgi:hypothetical protein
MGFPVPVDRLRPTAGADDERRCTNMRPRLAHVAAAAAIAGFLGFGGVQLAYAQTTSPNGSTETPSTSNGSTTTPQQKPTNPGSGDYQKNCPNMGGNTGNSGSSSSTNEGSNV